jgi:uncharacterized protein (TIGR02145 family)
MKRRFLFFLVLAGILFSSCAVDEIPSGEGSISALMENEDTRTSVTDEGAFTWSYGDKVWLETTTGNVTGSLSSGAGTSSAQFSYGAYFGEMTGKAVYPYNSGHSISENVLSVAMPASYDLGSSLGNTNAAMYGVNVGGTLKFSHLAGVMRFKFNNVPAGVNKFTITLDKKINGTFGADLRADYPVIETSATSIASEKTITLTFDALTKTSDICLYVPLPLGTYTSLELGIYDDGQSVWSYSNSVTNTISRKTLKLMPAVTFGGFIGGDIEGGGNTPSEPQEGDYIDEYGINHGQGTRIGETVWAPVNCGYHKDHFKYGKLYQWGRKYGQGYSGDIYDGDWDQTFSDALIPTIEQGRIDVLTGNQKSSADIFYIGTYQYNYDWADSRDDKLWNSGTEDSPVKTGYDPCPDGWRVPTCAELDELNNNYSWSVDENGRNGYWFSGANTYTAQAPQVFFPAAGYRVSSDGYADYRGSFGDYWSSRPNNICAYALVFDRSGGFMEYRGYRASGYSVRCVRE